MTKTASDMEVYVGGELIEDTQLAKAIHEALHKQAMISDDLFYSRDDESYNDRE